MSKVKLSNEEIIEIYKEFVKVFGKTPTQNEMREKYKNDRDNFISVELINSRFGGLTNLNTLCGIELNYKLYTEKELIDVLIDCNNTYGFPDSKLIRDKYNIDRNIYAKRFGSFKEALIMAKIEIPQKKMNRLDAYRDISNEDALKLLKDYCDKHGRPTQKDLIPENNLPSFRFYSNRFGSMENILNQIGFEIDEQTKKLYFSEFKNISDEELLEILKDYDNNIGFPTQRKFISSNNLPSYTLYADRFGSFRNAIILANIIIPKNRERWFDREELTNEEMLKLLEYQTKIKLISNIYLLTNDEINSINEIPHSSTYYTRFGGIIDAYKQIGINYEEFNNKALEKDMILKYKELYKILGRTPHSRDIEYYSRKRTNGFYCMGAYEDHFGGIYKLQIYCDFLPTEIGRQKSSEELIEDLQELYERLGRVPTQRDVDDCEWVASANKYHSEFNTFTNALKVAGFKDDKQSNNCLLTPQGNYCRSSYEYDFCTMLEGNSGILEFWQEDYYYNYIKDYTRRHRFDYTVKYNNKIYPIEIFGMMEHEWYREKTKLKIDLCKNNNINLIDFYKEDFKKKNREQLYEMLMKRIKEI